jgi:signal transduction histidine kinase
VRLSAGERGGRVAVSVSDDGPGLGQDELDYVFHADLAARTRLRRPLAPGGLGLGLSLVRYWVRAMGGRVEARSRPAGPARGPGTDVAVILPAVDQR